jgi:CubicO group peptidase (beta-lactamase class C family)
MQEHGRPAEHGFDETRLSEITQSVGEKIPFLDSLLIIRDGYIIHESYYNDFEKNTLHDIASVTKSWTSALVGMARSEGKLADLDAPLPDLLPGYFAAGEHADKSEITLRHLLQMRSGIEYDEDALV